MVLIAPHPAAISCQPGGSDKVISDAGRQIGRMKSEIRMFVITCLRHSKACNYNSSPVAVMAEVVHVRLVNIMSCRFNLKDGRFDFFLIIV